MNEAIFTQIQQSGINWASSAFENYLMAGLDEAYAVALYSSSCDTVPIQSHTFSSLSHPLYAIAKRDKVGRTISNPQFGVSARNVPFTAALHFVSESVLPVARRARP